MKTILRVSILLLFLTSVYLLLSWLALDGRIVYWTSFNSSSIPDSKKEGLFVTDSLTVIIKGDSLANWRNKFNIWTNDRYEIKFWGILFHWTYHDSSWRYLNLEPKNRYVYKKWCRSKLYINDEVRRDYMQGFTGSWEPCCNRISCDKGDTVKIEFIRTFEKEIELGAMTIIVE